MQRSRTASIALAAVLLAGCGSGAPDEPAAPPSEMTESSQASETPSPSPTATPVQPPANLPSQFTGQPVWTAPGQFVVAFPDVVVTVTSDEPATLAGTAPDGTQRWSVALKQPAEIGGRPSPAKVMRLRNRLAVIWTGDSATSPDPTTDLTLLDPATGQEVGRPSGIPTAALFTGQSALDSFAVQLSTNFKKLVTLGADDELSVSNLNDGPSIAKLDHEDRIGSAPAKGAVNTTGELVVSSRLSVRQFETLADRKRYYQVVDTSASRAVGPATPCADRFDIVAGVKPESLSPSATVVGVGQAVVHLDTGKVACLATLSQDVSTTPTVVGDDGATFGEAHGTSTPEGTFSVDASGEGSVDPSGAALPVALLPSVATCRATAERRDPRWCG